MAVFFLWVCFVETSGGFIICGQRNKITDEMLKNGKFQNYIK